MLKSYNNDHAFDLIMRDSINNKGWCNEGKSRSKSKS